MSLNSTVAKTIALTTAASPYTAHATPAGKFFVVYEIFIQAEADTDVTLVSNATNLTGAVDFTAARGGYSGGGGERHWGGNGEPIFKGLVAGDDFIITQAVAVQLNGWAVIGESDK